MLRWARALWPLVFLLPLGVFAGQLCWINIVDPAYHALLWLHEHLPAILVVFAIFSIGLASYRFIQVQDNLRLLLSFRSEPPEDILRIFRSETGAKLTNVRVQYIDVPARFCFTIFSGPSIVISRGFVERLSVLQLAMVAKHEMLHVKRRDPWRSISWHLFFAGLVLPGFEGLEAMLHLRRERAVDLAVVTEGSDRQGYRELLKHCSKPRGREFGAICTSGFGPSGKVRDLDGATPAQLWVRSLPALISITTLGLVVMSHSFFMSSLPYLRQHHC